jgi:hypothetical protein
MFLAVMQTSLQTPSVTLYLYQMSVTPHLHSQKLLSSLYDIVYHASTRKNEIWEFINCSQIWRQDHATSG